MRNLKNLSLCLLVILANVTNASDLPYLDHYDFGPKEEKSTQQRTIKDNSSKVAADNNSEEVENICRQKFNQAKQKYFYEKEIQKEHGKGKILHGVAMILGGILTGAIVNDDAGKIIGGVSALIGTGVAISGGLDIRNANRSELPHGPKQCKSFWNKKSEKFKKDEEHCRLTKYWNGHQVFYQTYCPESDELQIHFEDELEDELLAEVDAEEEEVDCVECNQQKPKRFGPRHRR